MKEMKNSVGTYKDYRMDMKPSKPMCGMKDVKVEFGKNISVPAGNKLPRAPKSKM